MMHGTSSSLSLDARFESGVITNRRLDDKYNTCTVDSSLAVLSKLTRSAAQNLAM